jgi:hypothetical protein
LLEGAAAAYLLRLAKLSGHAQEKIAGNTGLVNAKIQELNQINDEGLEIDLGKGFYYYYYYYYYFFFFFERKHPGDVFAFCQQLSGSRGGGAAPQSVLLAGPSLRQHVRVSAAFWQSGFGETGSRPTPFLVDVCAHPIAAGIVLSIGV